MGAPAPQGVAASGQPPLAERNGVGANAVVSGTITAVGPTVPFAFRGPINLIIGAAVTKTLTTTAASLAATLNSATNVAAGGSINSANVPPGTTIGVLSGTDVTLAVPPVTIYGVTNTAQAKISGLISTTGLLGAAVSGYGIAAGATVTAIDTAAIAPGANNSGSPGAVSISVTPSAVVGSNSVPQPFVFTRTGNAITATGADAAAIITGVGSVYVGQVQLERSFDGGSTFWPCNIGGSGAIAMWDAGTPVSITYGEPEKNVLYRLNCLAYTSGNIAYRISQTGAAAESLAIAPPI